MSWTPWWHDIHYDQSSGTVGLFLGRKIYNFIQQGCTKLIKSDKKAFNLLPINSISNKCLISIHQRILKKCLMVSTKPLIGTTIFNTDNPNPRKEGKGKVRSTEEWRWALNGGQEKRGTAVSSTNRLAEEKAWALMCCMWRIYCEAELLNQWCRKRIIRTHSPPLHTLPKDPETVWTHTHYSTQ